MLKKIVEKVLDEVAIVFQPSSKVFWGVVLFIVALFIKSVEFLPPDVGGNYSEIATLISSALLIFGLWDSVQNTFSSYVVKVREFVKTMPGISIVVSVVFYIFDNYTSVVPPDTAPWFKTVIYGLSAAFSAMKLRSTFVIAAASTTGLDDKQKLLKKNAVVLRKFFN